jgi:hypothetical protein
MCVDVLKLARELPLAEERFWYGDATLIARPAAAVLNSHQGRHPHGGEEWVRGTLQAVAAVGNDEKVLLSSTGLVTWGLATWAAAQSLNNIVLLVPIPEGTISEDAHLLLQNVMNDFGLTSQNSLLVPFFVPPRGSEKMLWKARDGMIMRNAEVLYPVSIKGDGFLASCLRDPRIVDKVNSRFTVPYAPSKADLPSIPEPDDVKRKLGSMEWDHVAHWTRISDGPWPGESRVEYFNRLITATDASHHSAEVTLDRILNEQCIRATGWRMPMNVEMVSMSALPPWEMVERMTWRKRYVRMNYEPWGIAVRQDAIQRLGGRPVVYGDLAKRKELSALDRMYFQKTSEHSDWENELEWRLRGDLELDQLADDEAIVFVPNERAVKAIQPVSKFQVIAIS